MHNMRPDGRRNIDPIDSMRSALKAVDTRPRRGRITKVCGTIIQATAFEARFGEICRLREKGGRYLCLAEVIGLGEDMVQLTPIGDMEGLSAAVEVEPMKESLSIPTGTGLIGRVLNGLGWPIDNLGPLKNIESRLPLHNKPPGAMQRVVIDSVLPTGIKAIDGLLTVGAGQRIGIYGVPGVGKSMLLSNIVRSTAADVIVCGMIGERGREVREFIESQLGTKGMARTVLVVATADRPAMERVKAAYTATTIAEYFRNEGASVLLLMDSVTRFARAQREIGLAAGEPPTRRGFPPSIFAALPKLFERAGRTATGSITAFYTVLVEGDINADPIAEETRSLLDGHIVLSQKLASKAQFPAIDILQSQSRLMTKVTGPEHQEAAAHFRRLAARYDDVEMLLQIGEYQAGADAVADEAVSKNLKMVDFLRQGHDAVSFDQSRTSLQALMQ